MKTAVSSKLHTCLSALNDTAAKIQDFGQAVRVSKTQAPKEDVQRLESTWNSKQTRSLEALRSGHNFRAFAHIRRVRS